jgi:hypothetical protein
LDRKYGAVKIAVISLTAAILLTGCGIPPMYWAIYHNENTRVDSMLVAGQDPNVRWLKSSPLHQAAGADNYQAVLLLLQHGADPLVKDQHKRTPLMLAQKRNKDARIIQVLDEAEARKLGRSTMTATAPAASYTAAPQPLPSSQRVTLSVMDLNVTSGLSPQEMAMLTDKLLNEFVAYGYYKVVERSKRDEILKEQGFQQSGACDQGACLVEAGQLLGVQKMVGGTIGKLGSVYAVELRIIDVKTGEIDKPFSQQYSGDVSVLLGAMKEAAWTFSKSGGGNTSPTQPTQKGKR